jgi:hypothetical protein
VNGDGPPQTLEQLRNEIGFVTRRMTDDLLGARFEEHLDRDDMMAVILRAHMLIERELTAIIERPLPHPERLRRSWSFSHRLELVAALGVLDEEDLPPFKYLNKLRDRAAHRLNYEISEDEQTALIERIRPEYAAGLEHVVASQPFPGPLRHAMKMLVLTVALKRHGLEAPRRTPSFGTGQDEKHEER